MPFELYREHPPFRINEVELGELNTEGGSRRLSIGGAGALPFLTYDGPLAHLPAVGAEVWDVVPESWPAPLEEVLGPVAGDPLTWARCAVRDWGAEFICLRLRGADPEHGDASPEACAGLAREVLAAAEVPLVILGCGNAAKDNAVLQSVCEACAGTRCLVGPVTGDNYRTIAAAAMVNGHAVIAQSPVDVNMQKQVCVLLNDLGMPQEQIVMDPTTGGLGYGLEYTYSVMERIRLAALQGEASLASPMIVFCGCEAWRAKEAKNGPADGIVQGVVWEALTAAALVLSGADMLVMLHPGALRAVRQHVGSLAEGEMPL
ncbi:MAG: acetyl-CoA decarbonylase/synthase complex subunit delta [Thermoanaerobacterales bacterium]|nr:acetyl-CoA decarbonylase/synthase complex subunit delta [Thermoanaerobacterales bacterium]